MRIILFCLLLALFALPVAAIDQAGSIEILTIRYKECLNPEPGIWVTPRLTLAAPFTVTGVVADNDGFAVSVSRTWIQDFRMVQWTLGVEDCRYSRCWILLAVGHRLTAVRSRYRMEIIHLWDSTPDPYPGRDPHDYGPEMDRENLR